MSLSSMTGFGRAEGQVAGCAWVWELRSVNGRGLDLKLKLSPGLEALEPGLREEAGHTLRRGNVGGTLSLKREDRVRSAPDPAVLDDYVRLALELAARIPGAPVPRAELLLALPGALKAAPVEEAGLPEAAVAAVRTGFTAALASLAAARAGEGARLGAVLVAQIDHVAALCAEARVQAADQPRLQQARMMDAVAGLLADMNGLSAERVAQEVALLAARSDVREELDRLDAHVAAARALLAEGVGVGRRFDFLVQEFGREVNTLCSKSASVALTATGLALKAVLEQVREQVQNVE